MAVLVHLLLLLLLTLSCASFTALKIVESMWITSKTLSSLYVVSVPTSAIRHLDTFTQILNVDIDDASDDDDDDDGGGGGGGDVTLLLYPVPAPNALCIVEHRILTSRGLKQDAKWPKETSALICFSLYLYVMF